MINVESKSISQGRPVTHIAEGGRQVRLHLDRAGEEGISSSNRSRDRALAKPNTHRAFHYAGWHRLQTSERQSEPIRARERRTNLRHSRSMDDAKGQSPKSVCGPTIIIRS